MSATKPAQPIQPLLDPKVRCACVFQQRLDRLGIDTRREHTIHGWRATARTLLHEVLGWPPEVIEHQLAHRVPDRLGAAYNRTKFLAQRREMMRAWADYLDALCAAV